MQEAPLAEFENPFSRSWSRFVFWFAFTALVYAAIATLLALRGQIYASVLMLAFAGALVVLFVRGFGQLAKRVVLSEQQLQAWPFVGRLVRVRWDEIGEVQHVGQGAPGGQGEERVRVLSRDRRTQIVLSDRLSNFRELMDQIRARAPQARTSAAPAQSARMIRGLSPSGYATLAILIVLMVLFCAMVLPPLFARQP